MKSRDMYSASARGLARSIDRERARAVLILRDSPPLCFFPETVGCTTVGCTCVRAASWIGAASSNSAG